MNLFGLHMSDKHKLPYILKVVGSDAKRIVRMEMITIPIQRITKSVGLEVLVLLV